MPVNLIILEQGEEFAGGTKAIRLTEAKTKATMVDEHISNIPSVAYCRFIFSCGETAMFNVLWGQQCSLFIGTGCVQYQILFSVIVIHCWVYGKASLSCHFSFSPPII